MHVEILRRLTTITGDNPRAVWDCRVVDDLGRVLWACDHGHGSGFAAEGCGSEQMVALEAGDRPAPTPFTPL